MPQLPPLPDRFISTHSIEEGLDFACNLLCSAVDSLGDANPQQAPELLRTLSQYISLRYAGELGLAVQYLAGLAHECKPDTYQYVQFWLQLHWIADEMGLSGEELDELNLPPL